MMIVKKEVSGWYGPIYTLQCLVGQALVASYRRVLRPKAIVHGQGSDTIVFTALSKLRPLWSTRFFVPKMYKGAIPAGS